VGLITVISATDLGPWFRARFLPIAAKKKKSAKRVWVDFFTMGEVIERVNSLQRRHQGTSPGAVPKRLSRWVTVTGPVSAQPDN